jgi:hypothetical protein
MMYLKPDIIREEKKTMFIDKKSEKTSLNEDRVWRYLKKGCDQAYAFYL